MQPQQYDKTPKHPPFPWKRLAIITVLFLFLIVGAIVLLLSTGHIIDYSWYYVVPVIIALIIGPMLTALQWLFPLSPLEGKRRTEISLIPLPSAPTRPQSTPSINSQKRAGTSLQPKPLVSMPLIRLEGFDLLRTLEGHSGSIYSVAISPDGNTLASGSQDGTIKLWNVHTGALLHTLKAYAGTVNRVAISSDGHTFVSGTEDGTLWIWNLSNGSLLRTMKGRSSFFMSVIISSDGQRLITASADHTIKIWNIYSGELLNAFTDNVYDIALSPDGEKLASSDKTIKIWNLQTGDLLYTLPGHSRPIYSLAISSDEQIIASGGSDRVIRIWDFQAGGLLGTLRGHSGAVNTVAISPVGQTLASGSHDSTVRVWNLHTQQLLYTLTGHEGSIFSVIFSPDGKMLISGGTTDKAIRVWGKK